MESLIENQRTARAGQFGQVASCADALGGEGITQHVVAAVIRGAAVPSERPT